MAEREGFEPSKEISPLTRLAGERLQPTRPSLREFAKADFPCFVAEGVGFEPTVPLGTTVFKTASLNHSDIPPRRIRNITYSIENIGSQNFFKKNGMGAAWKYLAMRGLEYEPLS